MKNIYESNPMNAPRLNADAFFVDYSNEYSYNGFIDKAFKFIEDFQLLNPVMWERFVNQFRENDADYEGGWRGEYWGKCMRGAAFVYSYTKNPELYKILEKTVRDMMASGRESEGGRISSSRPSMLISCALGTKPIGVSFASTLFSQRSKIHSKTRRLSPKPGQIK